MSGRRGWSRAIVGSATVARDTRAIICLPSTGRELPNREVVEVGRQGLWLGAPEGAVDQVAVGGRALVKRF